MKLPKKVRIRDVGPRDGFQNVRTFIDTDKKLEIIDGLVTAGIQAIEITSFVNPKAIPQMADAAKVAAEVRKKYPDLEALALVPNLRGAENASKAGIRNVAYVVSASEAHNKANVNRSIDESVENLKELVLQHPELNVRVDIATAFGCPYSGTTPPENVFRLLKVCRELRIQEVTLCDTIGIANPKQVSGLLNAVKDGFPELNIALHLHNTRGMALANMAVAAECGITNFETSVGGLGGCPFAPGSEGNAATEDTVYMFEQMGVETGIDLEKLIETVSYVQANVDALVTGKMLKVKNSTCINF
ncbi:hydroxymethylglutaryl-CoA lyase [Lactonifactor longoviformis]|uniref:hydroxymethylglutaryl-CoA lyase n=1 Tax=Lactonifactor longoviformis TaxID=341220 RepID=UPI0036F36949